MRTMIQKMRRQFIISLHIQADCFQERKKLDTSAMLSSINFLTLYNLEAISQIADIRTYLPNITDLSIRSDDQIEFHTLCRIFNVIPDSIKKFKIYGSSIPCTHKQTGLLFNRMYNFNKSIELFILNVNNIQTSLSHNCAQYYETCILRTICDFIRVMSKIQSIYIVINTGDIETLLDTNEWKTLVEICTELKKITLIVKTNISKNLQLRQKIEEVMHTLEDVRGSIQFQVKLRN